MWIGKKKYSSQSIKTKWKLSWGKTNFKLLGIDFNVDLEKMININYKDKIDNIKNLIKQWRRRFLTPLGKITVIKSLLLAKLNHLFISLPNPNDLVIKQLNTLFYDFIWDGTPKIKKLVLVNQYLNGGLKMTNIEAFIQSLKATWIRRWVCKGGKWTDIIGNKVKINDLVNFGNEYTSIIIKSINNIFWKDTLHAYYNLVNETKVTNQDEFLSSPIFYNGNILVDNKPINLPSWIKHGVIYINDIIRKDGTFYNENEFKNIYGIKKNNFIQYNGIIKSIKTFSIKSNVNCN